MTGFVYRWYDRLKNMHYFGSHWGPQDDGYVCSSAWMLKAYRHRPDDFRREILAVVTTSRKDLLRREQFWLDRISQAQLGKGFYNLQNKHTGHWSADEGKRMTVGEKISAGMTPEVREKKSALTKGKPKTLETRQKMKAAAQRRKERGWTHSPASREKISVAGRGRTATAAARANMKAAAAARRGKPLTAKARAAYDARLGRCLSPETCIAISDALKGKPKAKTECPHCQSTISPAMFARWHGDRCRHHKKAA